MSRNYTVCIVDDHDIVRQGLVKVFSPQYDFDVIGEAGSYKDAKKLLSQTVPDCLILDQMLGDGTGLQLASEIYAENPQMKIILLTAFPISSEKTKKLDGIISAFLYKDSSSETIRQKVWNVLGESSELKSHKNETHLDSLSHREEQVLKLIARGLLNKEISAEIGISEKTVRNTLSRIYKKLSVSNRTEATLYFLQKPKGIHSPDYY
jgi:two-component system, NarL family, response regulator DevR